MEEADKQRIEAILAAHPVVLFMKGPKESPQCGFSSQAVSLLGAYLGAFHTEDVLADPSLREAVKAYSEWPTIPQIYVNGEFLGGVDILQQLFEEGELAAALGCPTEPEKPPQLTLSPEAAAAIQEHLKEGQGLRLTINAKFQARLDAGVPKLGDFKIEGQGVLVIVDRASALRADGVRIEFVSGPGGGFRVDNPNAPAEVKSMDPLDLQDLLEAGEQIELVDVRPAAEAEIAQLAGGRLLDEAYLKELRAMPKDTPILCYGHTGARSQAVAKSLVDEGFTDVYSLEGGIDAWALYVDNSVRRY